MEDEGQIDNIYQSLTAVTGQPSGSKEDRREYQVQWEQEFTWLRKEGGKMFFDICRKANMSSGGCPRVHDDADQL